MCITRYLNKFSVFCILKIDTSIHDGEFGNWKFPEELGKFPGISLIFHGKAIFSSFRVPLWEPRLTLAATIAFVLEMSVLPRPWARGVHLAPPHPYKTMFFLNPLYNKKQDVNSKNIGTHYRFTALFKGNLKNANSELLHGQNFALAFMTLYQCCICSKCLKLGIKWKVSVISIISAQSWSKIPTLWQVAAILMTLPPKCIRTKKICIF